MDILDKISELSKYVDKSDIEQRLKRMSRLLDLLGHPEDNLKIIHVAGTNGKGSCCYYMKSLLEEAGYTVGMFTSPHVMDFCERFQYNSECISYDEFERYAEYVLSFNDRLAAEGYGNSIRFEVLTCVAYLYFNDRKPDFVIMEAGIGGRTDPTNSVRHPEISVITQVDIDHVMYLGNTLEQITTEKSYIIKRGVPVVSQSEQNAIREILRQRADDMLSEFIDASLFRYTVTDPAMETLGGYVIRFDAEIDGREYKDLALSMLGEHQVRNAITAVTAVGRIAEISEEQIRTGLIKARNPGRFEFIGTNPVFIIDGAHNPNGIDVAIKTFDSVFPNIDESRLLVVFGCLSDKECDTMIDKVAERFRGAKIALAEPNGDRAVPATELEKSFGLKGIKCAIIDDVNNLLDSDMSEKYDVILTIGSIYLIGDIRKLVMERM